MSMKRSLRATPPSPITAPKLVTLAWLVVLSMLLPLWVMALACVYFGLDTDLTISAARAAAEGLMAGTSGMR